MRVLMVLVMLLLSQSVFAQTPKPKTMRIGEPSSIGIAMLGAIFVSTGTGVMLWQDACQQNCPSNVPHIIGGSVVVAAGVTMVYLGLRPKTVIIAPMVTSKMVGVAVRWSPR